MKQDKRTALTPKEIAMARRLHASYKMGWYAIAERMARSYELIRRACDPDYSHHRNELASRRRYGISSTAAVQRQSVPQTLLDDRERRNAAPRTLTAMICGDPPPGYSALDEKSAQENPR